MHFYGFHTAYAPFLKVLLADPAIVSRTVTLLQTGAIMKTRFRVYEAHLNYILQFMSDFGLYGCGWVDLAEVWQRDKPESGTIFEDGGAFSVDAETRNPDPTLADFFKSSPYYCQTRMPLELDAAAHQILNRHQLTARSLHHTLTIPAPELPAEPVVLGVRELWDDERQRRSTRGLPPTPTLPPDPSASKRGPGGGWDAEVRWWEALRKRVVREREVGEERPPGKAWERWVMSTFESVEALWEHRYQVWRPTPRDKHPEATETADEISKENPYGPAALDGLSNQNQDNNMPAVEEYIDVDETMLSSQELSRVVEQEEIEWAKREDGQPEPELDGGDIPDEALSPEDPEEATPHASPVKYIFFRFT